MKLIPAVLLVATACGLAAQPATAATYKWTDDNGNVVYGDAPPSDGAELLRKPGGMTVTPMARPAEDPTIHFPQALRRAAQASPVALYVAKDCAPCGMAAAHLRQRGIPFQEWKVHSHADFARFKELGFTGNGFPAITIGGQRSVGYEVNAWNKLLDAAQYPSESELPATYKYPAAASLSPDDPMVGAASFHQPPQMIDRSEVRPAGGRRVDPGAYRNTSSGNAPESFRF